MTDISQVKMTALSRNRACEIVSYDPITGGFVRLQSRRSDYVGRRAGSNKANSVHIEIGGRSYLAHRLAWLIMTGEWPSKIIDHKDGNPLNNSWSNLRSATQAQNVANAKKDRRNNTSGFKGVSLQRATGRWSAYIKTNGKNKFLGTFNTPQEASSAYAVAAHSLFGEFARVA